MWWQVSSWFVCLDACWHVSKAQWVCLAQCNPHVCMFLPCLQHARGLVQNTDRCVRFLGPEERLAQLHPCGQVMQHKARYCRSSCILVLRGLSTHSCPKCFSFFILPPLPVQTKTYLWACTHFLLGWQVGTEVWYKYTLIWSGLWVGSILIFHSEQAILLCVKLSLKWMNSIKKTTTTQL